MSRSNSEKTIPYLQAIAERRLKDSEEAFEKIRGAFGSSQWDRGYVKALEGLLLTLKSNDTRYLYLQRMKLDDTTLKKLKEEFKKQSTHELHADYDRGYFAALTDYASVLEHVRPWKIPHAAEETLVTTEASSKESLPSKD
jgi:hypothetical protein